MFKGINTKSFNSIIKILTLYAYVQKNHNSIVRENTLRMVRIYWNVYQSSGEIGWQATSYYLV